MRKLREYNITFALITILHLLLSSCTCNRTPDEVKTEIIKDTTVTIVIKRYEQALFNVNKDSLDKELKRLKPEYSFFLDADLNDKENIAQIRSYLMDPQIIENYETTQKIFPNTKELEKQLSAAFTVFKYYFPEKRIPDVFTYVCGMDFEHPVIFADSVLLIALDMYLGKDYKLYQMLGLPMYIRKYMSKEYIVRDCMKAIAEYHFYKDMKDATLLDYMIYEGKKQYFIDAMLPAVHDTIKLKYSKKQLDWCMDNESKMWAFFIDKKLLYSTDLSKIKPFINEAPFTISFSKQSAPRTATWIGLQILKAYKKQFPDTSLKELMMKDNAQEILKLSRYKPQKT